MSPSDLRGRKAIAIAWMAVLVSVLGRELLPAHLQAQAQPHGEGEVAFRPEDGDPQPCGAAHPPLVRRPGAVELISFEATAVEGPAILVTWVTGTETDMAGFFVWRSLDEQSHGARISGGIPAEGALGGASYEYLDTGVEKGVTYYYWLEAQENSGHSDFFGPTSATVGPLQFTIYLPLVAQAYASPLPWAYECTSVVESANCERTWVHGTVLARDGRPQGGVQIRVGNDQGWRNDTWTDETGTYDYVFANLPVAGRWYIQVFEGGEPASGERWWETTYHCTEPDSVQEVEIVWQRR